MKPTTLALDLEGTLISNAVSQIPRPGLYEFLEEVRGQFDRLVMFTTVPEARLREIMGLLVQEGSAPPWFAQLDNIAWSGATKDLAFVSPRIGEVLLVDDHGAYVHAGQEPYWIPIPLFGAPYEAGDTGLAVALGLIAGKLAAY
ncbi:MULTISPECIES: NIF family HAD-type phosphatase [Stenotrophomonas]|uniref:NIF family HAD-type phosphatase n=1 Tax=Stenotrophomonas TaxID=40323 RepID=UPI00066EF135|nr:MULTISPECIES: NIF family HAD-type phosphatase [Stenotrophomonas]MBA0430269.1 hypothetical protein [Stenotrophomonas maltophilia]MBH1697926.1 hypothetical protein [Stenotrophomonas maltophilia]MBH1710916.1 hypothetical protein [Stenotrophomonas maltophilia]MBH1761559.1 hypothetical protein [Stenotrophomonas maltophilia]MBH1765929.1 hypothetical protein [Stenotrophomonas maltophilia]